MSADRKEIEQTVMDLILDFANMDEDEISMDMDFMDEIGLSSLELMQVITGVENEFGIKFESKELKKIFAPEDLIDLIQEKME